MQKKILIFVPSYNVENMLVELIRNIPKSIFFLDSIQILFINDHSIDNTKNVIKNIVKSFPYSFKIITNTKNHGYGGVQKIAYNYAIINKFDFVIMLHGDGQYTPKLLPLFIKKLKNKNNDAVFGSRMFSYKSAIRGGMPLYKLCGNIFLSNIQNIILRSNFSEFHSGYRSFKVKKLKEISFNNNSNYYHFDTQIIIQFLKKKYFILELPIPTIYKDEISHLRAIPYGLSVLWVTILSIFK
jgi:glycosyltransferase involved in cell wall biosynthesis